MSSAYSTIDQTTSYSCKPSPFPSSLDNEPQVEGKRMPFKLIRKIIKTKHQPVRSHCAST